VKSKNKKQFNIKTVTGLGLVIVFLFGFSFDIGANGNVVRMVVLAGDDELTEEEKKAKEEETEEKVDDKKDEIKKLKKRKKKKEEVKAIYVNEANAIKGSISNLVGDINTIEKKIGRTEEELGEIGSNIKKKEEAIISGKRQLAALIRRMNRQNIDLKLTVLDSEKGLVEYVRSKDLMAKLQKDTLANLNNLKEKRRELEKKKKEEAEAKEVLDSQKTTLEKERVKKSWVLSGKNKKISEQDAGIRQIENEMAALNSAISSLLGKSFNTNDIKKAAGYASKKTGVRKAFILGMLTVETNLGRYTGGCNYKESRMNSHRKTLFRQICKKAGRNYKKMKVSCPPANYRGPGGAMGVAQFMSDTWIAYESKIKAATGHKNPDPWDLTDGVMAMAIKLGNDGATKKSGECRAAMRYLGGSHQWYCDKVLNYAKRY
jgi:membrane-bound lytic murein transglycosylase B